MLEPRSDVKVEGRNGKACAIGYSGRGVWSWRANDGGRHVASVRYTHGLVSDRWIGRGEQRKREGEVTRDMLGPLMSDDALP